MLIICNGTFKSGSSWLHAILIELLRIKKVPLSSVPDHYTNDIHSPTKIIESKIDEFIFNESFDTHNYLTKSHFFKISTLSSPYPDTVKFLFVERDIKDAIVSHYYHIQNKFRKQISFRMYYFFLGRYKAYEIYLFNERCKRYFGLTNFILYHDLKNSFNIVINKLCDILQLDQLNRSEMQQLIDETTIEKLREKSKIGELEYYPSRRHDNWKQFRTGLEGDWKHHFSDSQLSHIEKIESGNASFFLRFIYFMIFSCRRYIFNIE